MNRLDPSRRPAMQTQRSGLHRLSARLLVAATMVLAGVPFRRCGPSTVHIVRTGSRPTGGHTTRLASGLANMADGRPMRVTDRFRAGSQVPSERRRVQ
jgi:hypothetical protein